MKVPHLPLTMLGQMLFRDSLYCVMTRIHDMRGKFNLFFYKLSGLSFGKETLIEKAYQEPYRGIVQADDALAL